MTATVFMIAAFALLLLAFIIVRAAIEDSYACYGVIILVLCSIVLLNISYAVRPRAIDVYRGRTTLEITSVNNVPVDSVVVFKK